MELKLLKAVVRPVKEDTSYLQSLMVEGEIAPTGIQYQFLQTIESTVFLRECALTRLYRQALDRGTMQQGDLLQVAFVDEEGNPVPYTAQNQGGLNGFFSVMGQTSQPLFMLGASQHMAEVGKLLVSTRAVKPTLSNLYGPEFAERMDLHKWLKIVHIACQPGRVEGEIESPTQSVPFPPVAPWQYTVYVDEKRPQEDGMIWVNPDIWNDLTISYSYKGVPRVGSTPEEDKWEFQGRDLTANTQLIKVNSSTADLTIKAVLMRAPERVWAQLMERVAPYLGDRQPPDIILCGNAIKDKSSLIKEHELYVLPQSYFAYHADSNIHRGYQVNVSKQIMTRAGMNTPKFLDQAIEPALDRVRGLMLFDEDHVLKAIGAYSRDGQETSLEHAAAVKKRIMAHGLPASHPVNALQIWRLGMTVIRESLARIAVEGFHGMGASSPFGPGIVGIPRHTYKRWIKEHGTNEVYLFRMPYLGSYCGRFAKVVPTHTDTIMVNWEDALQMEGDFDGDQYFVVPSKYISTPSETKKPIRPLKTSKAVVELDDCSLHQAIIELATNKVGIGPRDHQLSRAYDLYHLALHEQDAQEIQTWENNIQRLQVYVQQAIEGLKHNAEEQLTEKDLRAMFGRSAQAHDYTKLISKRSFRIFSLQSTRLTEGYIDKVRSKVKPEHAWHPLHGIFSRLAQLEFGQVTDVEPYWNAVRNQKIRAIPRHEISKTYGQLRDLHSRYTKAVRRWDGGRNKNFAFGKDVLEPIRTTWNEMLAAANGDQAQVRDLHLMLAKVGYEPQPNWQLVGGVTSVNPKGGLIYRMKNRLSNLRGIEEIASLPPNSLRVRPLKRSKIVSSWVCEYADHKPLLDGIMSHYGPQGYQIRVRRFLPRTGSLFHHLAQPELARSILDSVLPKVSTDELITSLLEAIRVG